MTISNYDNHEIKNGTFYCQEITVHSPNHETLIEFLKTAIKQFPHMYENQNFSLNFSNIEFSSDEQQYLIANNYISSLIECGHKVVGTIGIKPSISKSLHIQPIIRQKDEGPSILSGTPYTIKERQLEKQDVEIDPQIDKNIPEQEILSCKTEIIKGHIRGGQSIISEGNVLIIGDVKHGAEVIAGGSITIYGKLQGRALAGNKEKDSYILATQFEPELVSVEGVYITSDKISSHKELVCALVTIDATGEKLDIKGK